MVSFDAGLPCGKEFVVVVNGEERLSDDRFHLIRSAFRRFIVEIVPRCKFAIGVSGNGFDEFFGDVGGEWVDGLCRWTTGGMDDEDVDAA